MTYIDMDILRRRSQLLRRVRSFFRTREYLEVDTAVLCPALIPESSLEVFQTRYLPRQGPAQDLFLIPSPELWMKRMIAAGCGSIFQICKSFRNSEPPTVIHCPEFTMLEWYSVGVDYLQSIDTMEELFTDLASELSTAPVHIFKEQQVDCTRPFMRLSMAEAFREYAKLDLEQLAEGGVQAFTDAARSLHLSVTAADRTEDLFQKIFLSSVEPNLPVSRPVVLYDYPALIPTLARRKSATPWAERWELYLAGVEIANCYTEETDPDVYEQYYRDQAPESRQVMINHPGDRELVRIIREQGFPLCSGTALGLDRLFMFLLDRPSISDLLPYGAFLPPA